MRKLLTLISITAGLALMIGGAQAQVRSSNNYQIQSDSVNFGGGFATSSNYQQESTLGEVATGPSDSGNYQLRAGYQQMQEVYLALGGGGAVTMSPAINGLTGGESNGSTTFTVTTDSPAGYQLDIAAAASPALQGANGTIADYVPAGAVPDLHFTTAPADAHFGFSPFGPDVADRFATDGSACDTAGSASSTACWDGLSTSSQTIAQGSGSNHPDGTDTTIYFKVGIGAAANQTGGTYVATTTVTLFAL